MWCDKGPSISLVPRAYKTPKTALKLTNLLRPQTYNSIHPSPPSLQYLFEKYYPNCLSAAYDPVKIINIIPTTVYFPLKSPPMNSLKLLPLPPPHPPPTPTTIPGKAIKLMWTLPLTPPKTLVTYKADRNDNPYTPDYDHEKVCEVCHFYYPIFKLPLAVPILPCATYSCIYVLHPHLDPGIHYVSQMGATSRNIILAPHLHRIRQHLLHTHRSTTWEIL